MRPAAPEEVTNVWAGDAVWFDAPVGDLRAPPVWVTVIGVSALLIWVAWVVMLASGIAAHDGVLIVAAVVSVIALGAATIGSLNAWLAERIRGRRQQVRSLTQLAQRCWVDSIADRLAGVRFNAPRWIRDSGLDGPRVVVREFRLSSIAADPLVAEEERILSGVERRRARRIVLWIQLGIVLAFITVALSGITGLFSVVGLTAVLAAAIVIANIVRRLGLMPSSWESIIASPGRISCVRPTRRAEFLRADSVLLLELLSDLKGIAVHAVRVDGTHQRMEFGTGVNDPSFRALISRWCWRDGAGKFAAAEPWCDARPVDSAAGAPSAA